MPSPCSTNAISYPSTGKVGMNALHARRLECKAYPGAGPSCQRHAYNLPAPRRWREPWRFSRLALDWPIRNDLWGAK
jgi:hypothetical protein